MPYGTVQLDTLQSSAVNTPVTFTDANGTQVGTLCRAWVRYNGSAQTITASFNVSSVTYNGTGDYTVNFTNALSDANYSFVTGNAVSGGPYITGLNTTTLPTSSLIRLYSTQTSNGAAVNTAYITLAIFR